MNLEGGTYTQPKVSGYQKGLCYDVWRESSRGQGPESCLHIQCH